MYDPNKQYQWKLDDTIEISGKDFFILQEALQQFIISSLDVPTILKLTQAYAVVVNTMNTYIDKGVITEPTATEEVPAETSSEQSE